MNEDSIKRSDAIKAVRKAYDEGMRDCPTYYLGIVPAVEPKQGEWITDPLCEDNKYCSECKVTYSKEFLKGMLPINDTVTFPHYCPICGARMKGANNDIR